MKVRFLAPAQLELDEAFAWYETEHKGLGSRFVGEVHNSLNRIVRYPHSCKPITTVLRRCPMRKFSYMIIYGVHADTIVVVAVAHLHRKPAYWQDR